MKILIHGAGWYGCHLALALLRDGHDVAVLEKGGEPFAGASGANPARLHLGFHYPRSQATRKLCQVHHVAFMQHYGSLTRTIPTNIYAVAAHDSLVDYGNYKQVLRHEVEFVDCETPEDLGLQEVEGAVLTGERHIVIRKARAFFSDKLAGRIMFHAALGQPAEWLGPPDWTIDCTFCARDEGNIDRFEPCVTGLLSGLADRAVTIMDGPFPSIYPWDPENGLSSITSAKHTPLARCKTYAEAQAVLHKLTDPQAREIVEAMRQQMATFWPDSLERYRPVDYRVGIRAMPRSGADARLVDVVETGERTLRIRAGKIDAVLHAEQLIKQRIAQP